MPYPLLAFLVVALGSQTADKRDTVLLKTGKRLTGRVMLALDDRIVLRVGTRDRTIARAKIESLSTVAEAHRKVHAEFRKSPNDARALMRLAESAAKGRLPHTAKLLAYRVLVRNPQHAGAHEFLGHKKRRGKWRVPGRGGPMTLERAAKVRRDWGKAWELRSEHWHIRCSSSFADAVNSLLDLEFAYITFLLLFQEELELLEVVQPVRVYLYNGKEFPEPNPMFKQAENALYLVEGRLRPPALVHEAAHGLIYNCATGIAGSRGSFPGWLDEGMAEYLNGMVGGGKPGVADFVPQGRLSGHVSQIRDAKRPFKLHRVLNFKSDDFHRSSKRGLKYAQAYALVHYMLTAAPEEQQAKFVEYVKLACKGQGQASTFRRLLRKHLKSIEKAYLTHMLQG